MVSVDIYPDSHRTFRCCIRLECRSFLFLLFLFHFLVLGPVLSPVSGSTRSMSLATIVDGSSRIAVVVVVAFGRVVIRTTLEGVVAADSMGSLSVALFAVPLVY